MSATPTVVVVGSGPIGSAYARTILENAPAARVLMLEAGPQLTERPGSRGLIDRRNPPRLATEISVRTLQREASAARRAEVVGVFRVPAAVDQRQDRSQIPFAVFVFVADC